MYKSLKKIFLMIFFYEIVKCCILYLFIDKLFLFLIKIYRTGNENENEIVVAITEEQLDDVMSDGEMDEGNRGGKFVRNREGKLRLKSREEGYSEIVIDDLLFDGQYVVNNENNKSFATSLRIRLPYRTEVLPIQTSKLIFMESVNDVITRDREVQPYYGDFCFNDMISFEELSETQELDGTKVKIEPGEIAVVMSYFESTRNVQASAVTNDTNKSWYIRLWDIVRPQGKIDQVKNKIFVKSIGLITNALGLPGVVPKIVGAIDTLNDEYFSNKSIEDEMFGMCKIDLGLYSDIIEKSMLIPWKSISGSVQGGISNEEVIEELKLEDYVVIPSYIYEFQGLYD